MKIDPRVPVSPVATPLQSKASAQARQPDEFSTGAGSALKKTALQVVGAPTNAPPTGDPYATGLKGLKYGAVPANATDTRIRQLQGDLIKMGYLPQNFDNDANYGKRFGPMTRTALEQLQSDHGIEPTGTLDDATLAVLQNATPATQAQLRGAAASYPQLGQPTGAAAVGPDGITSQSFENGSVALAPDGTVTATDASGQPLGTQHVGTFGSTNAANAAFINQDGNTPWFTPPDPKNKFPFGHNDCGPTSGLMALSALGLTPRPSAAGAPTAIDHMRDVMLGYDSTQSQGMGFQTVKTGLEKMGATCSMLDISKANPKTGTGLDAIDAALDRGHPVIIGGDPANAWGPQMLRDGEYGDTNKSGTTDFGHFCCVLGKAADGNYIVGDPLSKVGSIEVSPKQLAGYMSGGFKGAMEVAP